MRSELLFLSIAGDGFNVTLQSRNLGNTWDTADIKGYGFTFFSDSVGFALTSTDSTQGFLLTADGGISWDVSTQELIFPPEVDGIVMPLAISSSHNAFTATTGQVQIYHSEDYGEHWTLIKDFGPPTDFHLGQRIGPTGTGEIAGDLTRLYIQTDTGMYISTDQGVTWTFDGGPPAINSGQSHRFYAGHGVTFASLDTGGDFGDGSLWEEIWPQSGVTQPNPEALANISVYPNPTTGMVTITGVSGPVEVENILGERVSIPHAPSPYPLPKGEEINIDLSRLPAGTYFVRVQTPDGMVLRRVVKQ